MTDRKKYLDYSKGLGILLIMLAHVVQYFQGFAPFIDFIGVFHVPIFFIVAGWLAYLKRHSDVSFAQTVKKRAKALLIAYVIFSLFNSALKLGVLFIKHSITAEVLREEMTALLITGNGTVWFLPSLFGAEILFWFIKKSAKDNKAVYAMLTLFFLILPYMLNDVLQFAVGTVLIRVIGALGYYLAGYTAACFYQESNLTQTREKRRVIWLVTAVCGIASYLFIGSNYNFFGGWFEKPVYSLITSVLLAVSVVMGFELTENAKKGKILTFMEYYGKNSLIVMLVHPTILLFITYPLAGRLWNMQGAVSCLTAAVVFAFITIAEIPCIYIINNYLPWVIGKPIKRKQKN